MIRKIFLLIALVSCLAYSSGGGLKLSFVAAEDIGPSIGIGGHGIIDLNKYLSLYPNLEFWYGTDNDHWYRYPYPNRPPDPWDDDYWRYYKWYEVDVFEISINVDFRFYFPVTSRVGPFVGGGIAPIITIINWEEHNYSDTDFGAGLNILGGVDFPVGNHTGFVEMKGKVGSEFNVFKLTFGITFG